MNNENKRLKRKVRNSYIISTVSISLVLFLLGTLGFLMFATMRAATSLQNNVTLIVELANGLSTEERTAIKERMDEDPLVREIVYSSKEEKIADADFRQMFSAEFEEVLEENPLLDSYEVTVALDGTEPQALDELTARISKIEGVEHVSYPAAMISTMRTAIDKLRPLLLIFAAVLAVISLTLLNNTIRLAIYSKRYVINTMKLVGATKWFIVRPFVGNSIKQGVVAGIIAAAIFAAMVYAVEQSLPEVLAREQLEAAAVVLGAMIAGGVLLSSIFTLAAVNKFVNMKSNKIHLY